MAATPRLSVLGAGAWGTALANLIARRHGSATLYARDPATAESVAKSHVNAARLPGIALSSAIAATAALERAVEADALLLAVPAQQLRGVAQSLKPLLRASIPLIACAKGIERGTGRFVTDVLREAVPQARAAILSGPSFAADVARGLPTAVTIAAEDEDLAASLAEALHTPTFRIYHSSDVRGVEIGGAAKNVLAIAAGIVAGRKLGASAQAALTTRGFAELVRFGRAYGARPETLMGLSGLGDVILTCSSPQSRNFALGLALGGGASPADAAAGKLAEGALTAPILVEMARAKDVDMPIAGAVDDVLASRLDVGGAIARLLARPSRAEA